MSVLIKGMEMPTSCRECWLKMNCDDCEGRECVCVPLHQQIGYLDDLLADKRRDDCTLVLVPEHYDLIDHNALKRAVMDCDAETRLDFLKHAMDCINKAPVVIPSDMPTYEAEERET